MGVLTGIKTFFSAPKVIDTSMDLLKKGASGIDMLFYTDEEKEISRKEWFEMVLKSEQTNQEQATERSKTRRILAVQFCKVYLSLILLSVAVVPFNIEIAKYIATQIVTLSYAVVPIIIFFFGSYGWGTYIKKKE